MLSLGSHQQIKPEDLWLDGELLNVRLPATEILVATLENDKSYVYDRVTGLFTHGDPDIGDSGPTGG